MNDFVKNNVKNLFVSKYLETKKDEKLLIVDLGSYDVNGNIRDLFNVGKEWGYFGVDIEEGPNVDIVLRNQYVFYEFGDYQVDVVVSCCTFEHIGLFWLTMKEISRILKVGGYCCIVAPFEWPEHKHPIDCYRFYPDGFRELAKWCGLETLETFTMSDNHHTIFIGKK